MFANLIIVSAEQGYRFNERETAAAFALIEKVAGFAGALLVALKRPPVAGTTRTARA